MEGKKIYTSFGQALNVEDIRQLPFIDSGTFGSVYDYGDGKVIKLLNHPDFNCAYELMDTISGLELPNFYKIYDVLSEGISLKKYAGNISSYHETEKIDIWEMPSEWLIENYEGLMESVIKLGEERIAIFDTVPCNCIMNKSGITIIDVDRYKFTLLKCVRDNIFHFHTDFIHPLLKRNGLFYHQDLFGTKDAGKVIKELAPSNNKDEKRLAKKLTGYKRPVDYLRDHIKY